MIHEPETLNKNENFKRLTMKALTKYKNNVAASGAMGISKRSMSRWKKKYRIKRDVDGSYYLSKKN